MSEPVTLAAYVLAGAVVSGLFGLLGAGIAVTVQVINARSAAKTADRAGAMAADAASFERVTGTQKIMAEAQVMLQAQANAMNATIGELQKEVSDLRSRLFEAISKLDASEKAADPLRQEIAELKNKVAGLEKLVEELRAVIGELTAQIKGQGEK